MRSLGCEFAGLSVVVKGQARRSLIITNSGSRGKGIRASMDESWTESWLKNEKSIANWKRFLLRKEGKKYSARNQARKQCPATRRKWMRLTPAPKFNGRGILRQSSPSLSPPHHLRVQSSRVEREHANEKQSNAQHSKENHTGMGVDMGPHLPSDIPRIESLQPYVRHT